ncbi:MAG: RT0821/Lpp0805 family surface protein [Pseudomonadota bacterium]
MIKQGKRLAGVVAITAALGGCQNWEYGEKQTAGAVIGGVGGAVLGSQVGDGTGQLVATAAGTLLGAWIGSEIGKSLDRADQQYATQSANAALERYPDGQSATWKNPNTGHAGSTTPNRTYEVADAPCREYQTSVVIDGRTQTAYGTACRQPDGTWRVVN